MGKRGWIPLLVGMLLMISVAIGAWVGFRNSEPIKAEPKAVAGLEKVKKAYQIISDYYVEDVTEETLTEGAIKGMLSVLKDPYSVYMDEKTSSQFEQSLDPSFQGIGAEISTVDGKIVIVSPFKGSPAEKAGLKPGDQIMKINGKGIEGLDLFEVVSKVRGKKGSSVVLEIVRDGSKTPVQISVKRDVIPLETIHSGIEMSKGKKVGYIEITSFSEETAQDFEKALTELEKEKIDSLLLDVRGNPGGFLSSVEEILSNFVTKDKPYILIEERSGKKEKFYSDLKKPKTYPIAVLIDKGSASAAEILAAAMQTAGGYSLIGETTFGKGTVQQAVPMGDGSTIKLTFFKWLTPDGTWIHKKGIEPTLQVKQPAYFNVEPLAVVSPLKKDMNNKQIETVQEMLVGLGFEPGRNDGYFNEQTEQAVKAFQRVAKLPVTGRVTQKTATRLQEMIAKKITDEDNDLQMQTGLRILAK